MLNKLLLTLAGIFLFAGGSLAQTGSLTGTITDSSSEEPVLGANIYILELQRGDATDFDGNFEITDLPYGIYTVRISSVGFVSQEQTLEISQARTELNLELSPDLQQLDDVVVTAFGLTREEKSVGYAVQGISGDRVARTSQENIVGALGSIMTSPEMVRMITVLKFR